MTEENVKQGRDIIDNFKAVRGVKLGATVELLVLFFLMEGRMQSARVALGKTKGEDMRLLEMSLEVQSLKSNIMMLDNLKDASGLDQQEMQDAIRTAKNVLVAITNAG